MNNTSRDRNVYLNISIKCITGHFVYAVNVINSVFATMTIQDFYDFLSPKKKTSKSYHVFCLNHTKNSLLKTKVIFHQSHLQQKHCRISFIFYLK